MPCALFVGICFLAYNIIAKQKKCLYNQQVEVSKMEWVDMVIQQAEVVLNERLVVKGDEFGVEIEQRSRYGLRCDGDKWRIFSVKIEGQNPREICDSNCD